MLCPYYSRDFTHTNLFILHNNPVRYIPLVQVRNVRHKLTYSRKLKESYDLSSASLTPELEILTTALHLKVRLASWTYNVYGHTGPHV